MRYHFSDPRHYIKIAYNIYTNFSLGLFDSYGNSIFDHRLGLVFPVSVFYWLFGMNIISTHLWMLISYIIIIFTVFASSPNYKSKIYGLALCCFSVIGISSTRILLPDLVTAAFMGLSYLLLLKKT